MKIVIDCATFEPHVDYNHKEELHEVAVKRTKLELATLLQGSTLAACPVHIRGKLLHQHVQPTLRRHWRVGARDRGVDG